MELSSEKYVRFVTRDSIRNNMNKPKNCKRCGKPTTKFWQVPFNKYDMNTKFFVACERCYEIYYKKEYESY